MEFYLGTHRPHWLKSVEVPLFVSRTTLSAYKALPQAQVPWALDSGGFTEIDRHGRWVLSAHRYIALVRRFHDEVGLMQWAAPQDWMCEPHMMKRTGLTVADHQRLTVENYLDLRTLAPDLPIIPVLQGWEPFDYLRHVGMYMRAGVDLESEPLVGLGTVCRRQATEEAAKIVRLLQPLRLHGFGMKRGAFEKVGSLLASADSMAWSLAGRKRPTPGCPKTNCANCLHYALQWRQKALDGMLVGRRPRR